MEIRVGKLLFFLLVALTLYVLLRGVAGAANKKVRRGASRSPRDDSRADLVLMVSCSHCGTHFPVSEALKLGKKSFCSEEHRRISQTSQQ